MKLDNWFAANAGCPTAGIGASTGVLTAPKTFADLNGGEKIKVELRDVPPQLQALAPAQNAGQEDYGVS